MTILFFLLLAQEKPVSSPRQEQEHKPPMPLPRKDFWETIEFSGFYRFRYYRDVEEDRSDERVDELRNELRIKMEAAWKDLKVVLSADGDWDESRSDRDGFESEQVEAELWEAYVKVTVGKLDVRIGKQILRWGKGDEVNPVDNFTPQDMSEIINHDRAERKIPAWMLWGQYFFSPEWSAELSWQPFFRRDEIPDSNSDWRLPWLRNLEAAGFRVEEDTPEDSVVAQRILYRGQGLDLDVALSYAYHYNQMPLGRVWWMQGRVEAVHHRQHTAGLEFETVLGEIGLRGEAAWTTDVLYMTRTLDVVFRDSLLFVVGADRTFEGDWYVNLQYSGRWISGDVSGLVADRYSQQVIWKVGRTFLHETLSVAVKGRIEISPVDYVLSWIVEYKLNDRMTVACGMDFYGGEEPGFFNQFDGNDQFWMRVKISY